MNDIIEWCNLNVGFATIVLSIGTLIMSLVAIIVSICTARLPYKKKLLLVVGSFIGIGIDTDGIHITATNIGNRKIKINKIGLLINEKYIINTNTIKESLVTLSIGDSTEQYFDNKGLKVLKSFKPNAKVYGYVEDTEGKIYKKYICKVNKIFF